MATPESVVNAFLSAPLTSFDEMRANYERYLADDVVWHTGTVLCNSRAEAIAHLERAADHYDMAYWRNEILHEAVNGNVVFNERLDHVIRHDGSELGMTLVCAVFEVRDDLIVAWRDYYDPTELREVVTAMHAERTSA